MPASPLHLFKALADDTRLRVLRCLGIAELSVAELVAVLALPQSFMNLSGQPARGLVDFYKIAVDDLLVVHDEVDLPFGAVRLKSGGGHGGHNGLRDLSKHLGPGYGRVRVGVSRPPEGWDTADYVLGTWTEAEESALPAILETACDAVEATLKDGLGSAMNHFNTRPKEAGVSPVP